MGTCEFCGRMIDDCRTSPCRAIAGEAGHATAAIAKAIDRLTEAVKALAPKPCRVAMYTGSDGYPVRCVLPVGHHGNCDDGRRR